MPSIEELSGKLKISKSLKEQVNNPKPKPNKNMWYDLKRYLTEFYSGLLAILITLVLAAPGLLLLTYLAGVLTDIIVHVFKAGYN